MARMTYHADIFDAAPLRLASRASQLAMVQAEMVCEALAPTAVTVWPVTTSGDRILDRPLFGAHNRNGHSWDLITAQPVNITASVRFWANSDDKISHGLLSQIYQPRTMRHHPHGVRQESLGPLPSQAISHLQLCQVPQHHRLRRPSACDARPVRLC